MSVPVVLTAWRDCMKSTLRLAVSAPERPITLLVQVCYTSDACYTVIVGCETVHDILLPYTDLKSRVWRS